MCIFKQPVWSRVSTRTEQPDPLGVPDAPADITTSTIIEPVLSYTDNFTTSEVTVPRIALVGDVVRGWWGQSIFATSFTIGYTGSYLVLVFPTTTFSFVPSNTRSTNNLSGCGSSGIVVVGWTTPGVGGILTIPASLVDPSVAKLTATTTGPGPVVTEPITGPQQSKGRFADMRANTV